MYLKNDILNNFTTTKKWVDPFAFSVEMAFARKKNRSSHQRCSVKKGVLRNFAKFTRKRLYWSLFLTKLQASRFENILKTDSSTDVFL